MSSDDLCWRSATELATLIRRRKLSPVEVVDAVLDRIERVNPGLNAYVTVTAAEARRAARAAERAVTRRSARLGPLHGVPFSVKDLVLTRGVLTTFGTPLFRDHVPAEDAPMVARLQAAGAILVGKTNTPTFGWIGATHNLLFGATRNPWQPERTPGGSSGGASAAVAAGLAPLAIGTDGGGSIRIPASFSGIFGLKPSFGRVPTYPPSGTFLSHIGPMTRTVADAALMLQVSAGPDGRDPYSLPAEGVDYLRLLARGVRGLRVAYAGDLGFAEVVDPEVATVCARAARVFRGLGCRVETVSPRWPSPGECWFEIFYAGIAARLLPFRDRRDEIDPGLAAILDRVLGTSPTRLPEAWTERLAWCGQHPRALFEKYDLLLTPTVACPAFPLGLDFPTEVGGTAVSPMMWTPFTFPFNLTGHPAASLPCGFTKEGLPVGLQIVGRRFEDGTVLRAAAAFERARPWANVRPPIST
jgi:aspartyl-tRNA(Asn)/glutamyl-tRNA(Gln) amidotransferase subunit A